MGTEIILIFIRGKEDICDPESQLDRREWLVHPTQKEFFCTQTRVRRRTPSLPRKRPKLLRHQVQRSASCSCTDRSKGERKSGCVYRGGREQCRASHMTRHPVRTLSALKGGSVSLSAPQVIVVFWRMFKAILDFESICSRLRTMEFSSSRVTLRLVNVILHVRVARFSCVITLKSCTVTTVDIAVIHDHLGGISSFSFGLVCAAVFLSTSLTKLLWSAALIASSPRFCFVFVLFHFVLIHNAVCLFVVGSSHEYF